MVVVISVQLFILVSVPGYYRLSCLLVQVYRYPYTWFDCGDTYSVEVSYNASAGCGGPTAAADFCISVDVYVGGLPNDEPCTATALPVNTNCVYTTSTTDGATDTPGVTAPGCANYLGSDVWFSAVVPANGAIDIEFLNGVLTDGGAAVYTGPDCSNLTLLECDDDDGCSNASIQFVWFNTGIYNLDSCLRIW